MRTQVAGKRWKLDINARQEALLMLSAVTLPGGVQVCQRATAAPVSCVLDSEVAAYSGGALGWTS